jgi:CTP:phosphocholine cytidylyltransferase-like protein
MPITPLEVLQNKSHFDTDNCKEIITAIDKELSNPVRIESAEYHTLLSQKRQVYYQLSFLQKTLSMTEQEYIRRVYHDAGWKRVDVKNMDLYRGLPGCRIRLFP